MIQKFQGCLGQILLTPKVDSIIITVVVLITQTKEVSAAAGKCTVMCYNN